MISDLFDYAASIAARDNGIATVESHNTTWLDRARQKASTLAKHFGEITSDDVRLAMGSDHPNHPNAWGAVFKDAQFTWTGKYRPSSAKSRHAGMQRVWMLTQHSHAQTPTVC